MEHPGRSLCGEGFKSASFKWTNTPAGGGDAVQNGVATADTHGLVTIESLKVTKGRNRVVIAKN